MDGGEEVREAQEGVEAGQAAAPRTAPEPEGGSEIALEPEIACELVSEHGGEIVILDDGRIVFMNASAHLVEIAHALDPDNPDLRARMAVIEELRRAREDGAQPAEAEPGPGEAAAPR